MKIRAIVLVAMTCALIAGCGKSQDYKGAHAALLEIRTGLGSSLRVHQMGDLLRQARMHLDAMGDNSECARNMEEVYALYDNLYQFYMVRQDGILNDRQVLINGYRMLSASIPEFAAKIKKAIESARGASDLHDVYTKRVAPGIHIRVSVLMTDECRP